KREKNYYYCTKNKSNVLCSPFISPSHTTIITTPTNIIPTIIRSSSLKTNNNDDYYEQCRVSLLKSRMDSIQISSFLKFVNYHISKRGQEIHDISKDLSNGQILIDLIEILSSNKLPREKGRTYFHSMRNVQIVLNYLKLDKNLTHLNICPKDVVSGNIKQILALLWLIIKTFNFNGFHLNKNKNYFNEKTLFCGQDRSQLLKWLNDILNKILLTSKQIYIKDFFKKTWFDGYYLSLLCKFICPLSIKYQSLTYGHQCLTLIQQINDDNNNNNRLDACLKLTYLCFNIKIDDDQLLIDENSHKEKVFFSYFCELQQCITHLFTENDFDKLKLNPYSKIIMETIMDNINDSSSSPPNLSLTESIDNDYLICIGENDIINLSSNEQSEVEKQNDFITVTQLQTINENQQNKDVLCKNHSTIVIDEVPVNEIQTVAVPDENSTQNEVIIQADDSIPFRVSNTMVENTEANLDNSACTLKNEKMLSINNEENKTINKNNNEDLIEINKDTELPIVNGTGSDINHPISTVENIEDSQPVLDVVANDSVERIIPVSNNNNTKQKCEKSKRRKKPTPKVVKQKVSDENQNNITGEEIDEISITVTTPEGLSKVAILQEDNNDENQEKSNVLLESEMVTPALEVTQTTSDDGDVMDIAETNTNHFTEKAVDNSVPTESLSLKNKGRKRKKSNNNKKGSVKNEVSHSSSKDLITDAQTSSSFKNIAAIVKKHMHHSSTTTVKYILFLVCLCFSILIIIVHH
ncbi:unnamed protein product, partial [Didymodactylos carnosus]